MKKLIIVGTSAFAEVAYEYFSADSDYEVVAFAVEKIFLNLESKMGLPVFAIEEIEKNCCPAEHYFFAALVYKQMNRVRTRLFNLMKNKGFSPASYVSKKAFVWPNVEIGEHCFIFEDNTVQPFSKIGNNVILWSGNHIGHHSIVGDNCFISSQVVVSGFCNIGRNCFFGVNSAIADQVKIADDCFVGPGGIVTKNTLQGQVISPGSTEVSKVSSYRLFKVNDNVG
jgi:sugar O-acyltransferase (sialic acid O-acetyltransferase NeuD family)